VRAGSVSAAALRALPVQRRHELSPKHCPSLEYTGFIAQQAINPQYHLRKLRNYRNFLEQWPDLGSWFGAPLAERVGRIRGDDSRRPSFPTSYLARSYLVFLGLRDYARFDYAWLLGSEQLILHRPGTQTHPDFGADALVDEAVSLGFNRASAHQAMYWSMNRIVLHTGVINAAHITQDHIEEALEAVRRFGERPDLHQFYGTPDDYRRGAAKRWVTHLHQLQVVLFHRGQVAIQPRKVMPNYAPSSCMPPRMQAAADRWLAARRLTDRPSTVAKLELAIRRFGEWIGEHDPSIRTFAEVNREHCLGFLQALAEQPTEKTGRPLGPLSRIQRISGLAMFFRDTAAWEWADVPGRPLLAAGDAPRRSARLPRHIPTSDLARLMTAILELPCPFQRTALLVARWSGARRGEIQRLALDCLDRYPDGTARLRLPAGKTYRERSVPLHEEAAVALQALIELRTQGPERAFIDELTGVSTRYLFMQHGKLLSGFYLFETPIQQACKAAGLVDAHGRGTASAHRFRHTVGTQLAERGAKLHTIMRVLGHSSVSMALVYAQVSDREVLRDYQAVLGPGATLAGPAAEELRAGALPASAVDWLKTNFFKTELELGHCLRLPQEGPCECDLYLTCAKFVTTPAYAPRLRERHEVELGLANDAAVHGWQREVERHQRTIQRIECLLAELGEPIDDVLIDSDQTP
jgi:integrase